MTSMNRYNQIMDAIRVTPEMEQRLLAAAAKPAKSRRWQRAGALAACLALLVCGSAVVANRRADPEDTVPPTLGQSSVTDFDSIEQLAASLDFPLQVPSRLPDGYAFSRAANQFGMAVAIYSDGVRQIKYCMAPGTGALLNSSLSGTAVQRQNAVFYGENGGYTAVDWQDGTYSYCLISDTPLSEEAYTQMMESLSPAGTESR